MRAYDRRSNAPALGEDEEAQKMMFSVGNKPSAVVLVYCCFVTKRFQTFRVLVKIVDVLSIATAMS